MTLSTVMATALAPFTSSSPAYTSAAPIAAWWAACAVTFVAACGGALLPMAATVGPLPSAVSLGSSTPSALTSPAVTTHPADASLLPADGRTAATVRRCTHPGGTGALRSVGPSSVALGPPLVNAATPVVTQCLWKAAIGPCWWLCCLACAALLCSYSTRRWIVRLILWITSRNFCVL